MEPTPKQISVLKQDFAASVSAPHGVRTGPTFDKFYCPILNEDSFGARGLMEGHILPVKLKSGSRATVVQRTDVDNYFGETIEPHLIDWVNLPRVTLKELLGKVSDLRATGLDGSESELFFANPQSKPPHPQIVLRDQKEGILGSPFLKTDVQNVPYRSHIKVVGTLGTSMPAIVGAFVKSAHLAMFRLTGYDWVFKASNKTHHAAGGSR